MWFRIKLVISYVVIYIIKLLVYATFGSMQRVDESF